MTESLINGNELDGSDIGKETIYSKTTNQLIRLQEILEGRRKEAEKSKYEIQKLISEIAHQLRTPLANIKNYTELLQEFQLEKLYDKKKLLHYYLHFHNRTREIYI